MLLGPEQIITDMKASGLRGRGGAGFPSGLKWSFMPKNNTATPQYLVVNADESEPGTCKDREIMRHDPHKLIEGCLVAGVAMRAVAAYIYIRGEFVYEATILENAIKEAYKAGLVGKNACGTGIDFDVHLHRGGGAYICGEETGLIESLEGKKGQPRLKPPYFPATLGLYYSPTVLNNVETYAAVPWIMNNGGDAYAAIGTEKSKGTKLVSVSGHVNKPGVYEIEMGYPFMRFLEEECGGVRNGRKLKAVIPGGSSMPVLRAEDVVDATMDYEGWVKLGSLLGSGGVIIMDDSVDMVDAILNLAHFYAHESCGQCTPCREGGHWAEKILQRMSRGEALPGDLELLETICNQIQGHTICALGDSIAMPVRSFITKFKDEFRQRILESLQGTVIRGEPLNASFGAHH